MDWITRAFGTPQYYEMVWVAGVFHSIWIMKRLDNSFGHTQYLDDEMVWMTGVLVLPSE